MAVKARLEWPGLSGSVAPETTLLEVCIVKGSRGCRGICVNQDEYDTDSSVAKIRLEDSSAIHRREREKFVG